jgi:hypothetical protein
MASRYTNLVFINSNVELQTNDKNERKMITKSKLKQGDGIIIEHSMEGEKWFLRNAIAASSVLFNSLAPRGTKWFPKFISADLNDEEKLIVSQKLNRNSFASINDKDSQTRACLGIWTSAFNHSCNPNAGFGSSKLKPYSNGFIPVFGFVIALNNIEANTEVTLMYSPQAGHDEKLIKQYEFECKCEKSDFDRNSILNDIQSTLAPIAMKRSEISLHDFIAEYSYSKRYKQVNFHQFLAQKECFLDDSNERVSLSDELKDKVKQMFPNFPVDEALKKWMEKQSLEFIQ